VKKNSDWFHETHPYAGPRKKEIRKKWAKKKGKGKKEGRTRAIGTLPKACILPILPINV